MLIQDYKHVRVTTANRLQFFVSQKPAISTEKYEQGYLQYFEEILDEFVSSFTMHGLDRIFKRALNKYEKITWIIGFSACMLVVIFVSSQVAKKYNTNPFITVVSETHYPVFLIPFPEVTICNKNRFNWRRFERAKEIFLKPEHQNNSKYQHVFQEVVNAYDTLAFGKFNKFENLTKVPPTILNDLSYVNFSMVSEFMAWKCYEILSDCVWVSQNYNCCEIFLLRNSQMGACLAFNTIQSSQGMERQKNDSFWPWRTKGQGDDNGLMVTVHLREFEHSPMFKNKKGILIMLAEPSVWSKHPIEVSTHTRTSISITASLHSFHNNTRIFSTKDRQCLFNDEVSSEYYKTLQGHSYMFENCQSECQQEYLMQFCNCTFDLFFPAGPYKPCNLTDFPCLFNYNDKLQYFEYIGEAEYVSNNFLDAMKCTCYYNCESLVYRKKVTTAYMSNMEAEFNNSFIDLSIYYQQDFIMVFFTTLQYTFTDLMASFGGLIGLFIGCSIISLVEFTYFFMVDIPLKSCLYYKMRKRLKLQKKNYKIKADIMENIMRN